MEFKQEQKLMQEIIQKAWEDATFKSELLSDPVMAIEKLTGEKVRLPEGKTLVVNDQTDESTVYITIPASGEMNDIELNEEQLEAVAGGLRASFLYKPLDIKFDLIGDSAPPQEDFDLIR